MFSQIKKLKTTALLFLGLVFFSIVAVIMFAVYYLNLQTTLGDRYYGIKVISQDITYYDEVLTMSARMNAYQNDYQWRERYYLHAKRLDNALEQATKYDPLIVEAIQLTRAANDRLIEMEERSFDLVAQGQQAAAIALLTSSEYQSNKHEYSKGIRLAMEKMLAIAEKEMIANKRQKTQTFFFFVFAFLVIFALLWFYLLRHMQTTEQHIHGLSHYDELSGLMNMHMYMENLKREIERYNRNANVLMLAIIDIDNFTLFNDSYGKEKSDELITTLAKVLADHAKRATESAYRLNGGRFALIVNCETEKHGLALVNTILAAIEDLKIPHTNNPPYEHVTASSGVTFQSESSNSASAELYQRADQALYKAKVLGNNRVETHS